MQEGRTYRGILQCLAGAAQKYRVVYVCADEDAATKICAAALKMANAYLSDDFVTRNENKLLFGNGGSILFQGSPEITGLKIDEVFYDDAA